MRVLSNVVECHGVVAGPCLNSQVTCGRYVVEVDDLVPSRQRTVQVCIQGAGRDVEFVEVGVVNKYRVVAVAQTNSPIGAVKISRDVDRVVAGIDVGISAQGAVDTVTIGVD